MNIDQLRLASESREQLVQLGTLYGRILVCEFDFDADLSGIADAAWDRAIQAGRKELLADVEQTYTAQKAALENLGVTGIPDLQALREQLGK